MNENAGDTSDDHVHPFPANHPMGVHGYRKMCWNGNEAGAEHER